MSEVPPPPSPAVTPPPAWYSTLDADHQAHITSRGWEKLEPAAAAAEAVKAHRAAMQMYDRVAGDIPKSPDEYKFDGIKFKDGTDLQVDDVEFLRKVATDYKMPVSAARGLATALTERVNAAMDAEGASSAVSQAANQTALRQSWAAEYDRRSFTATRAVEAVGFSPEVLAYMASLPPEKYIANMNALVTIGSQLTEAAILRGGGAPTDQTAGMSREQAGARLDELKGDRATALKYLDGDRETVALFNKLMSIMAGGASAR